MQRMDERDSGGTVSSHACMHISVVITLAGTCTKGRSNTVVCKVTIICALSAYCEQVHVTGFVAATPLRAYEFCPRSHGRKVCPLGIHNLRIEEDYQTGGQSLGNWQSERKLRAPCLGGA
jgi:hypothetical protein